MEIEFPKLEDWIQFTGIYGSPRKEERKVLYTDHDGIARKITSP